MTNKQLEQLVIQSLEPLYGIEEARSLQRYLFRALTAFDGLSEWLLIRDKEAGKDLETDIRKALDELLTYKPIQYVTGKVWFCDFEFMVRPGVLIPRPETEELVYLIRNRCNNRRGLRILDIGTGSGAIAVSLAKLLKDADVEATDVSDEALSIAAVNAGKLGAGVGFRKEDILNPPDGECKPVYNL
ncbi:MAG TPA: methyltransferase domain-containing protein, partial [Lentimicrobium sp.]|nr:methyltransferase domain-containing protein [Lentimicrobium sp.]